MTREKHSHGQITRDRKTSHDCKISHDRKVSDVCKISCDCKISRDSKISDDSKTSHDRETRRESKTSDERKISHDRETSSDCKTSDICKTKHASKLNGMSERVQPFLPGWSADVYTRRLLPKPRLIVFGAGTDARPVVALAAQCGFAVTVCDPRPALCDRSHFPGAAACLPGFPNEILGSFKLSPLDFVLIMTHDFGWDRELLQALLPQELRYIGLIGSRQRTMRLLGGEPVPPRFHAPVGLAIGAEGPEQITVSIVAELIRAWRQAPAAKETPP